MDFDVSAKLTANLPEFVIDWSDVMARPDTRNDYRELREIGFGFIGDCLYCVFTQRGDTFHVISLRKANTRVVKDYAANY